MVATCGDKTRIDRSDIEAFLTSGCLAAGGDGRVWIGWGALDRRMDPVEGRLSIYAPDFFLHDERPWRIYERSANVDVADLLLQLDRLAAASVAPEWTASPRPEFEAAFEDIQRRIREGTLVKAVPFIARYAPLAMNAPQRAAILANVLRNCQGTFLRAYGLWRENSGMIGATPETLFQERWRAGAAPVLETMALAGTRTPHAPSLLGDPKEMHEHRVVVDGIVERLSPLARVVLGPTDELRLPHLVHLYTPIEAAPTRRVSFEEWVAALHPTAAIGAWPKVPGWRWLQDQPNAAERGRYGAPFGFVPPNATVGTCYVAIRNLQWQAEKLRILAGGGIVAASQADREWREFNAKLDSIQGALGL